MQTLLLTWTIKPNNDWKQKSTVLSDRNFFVPEYRLKQYISTILYYITQSNFDNIVFCENSNYGIKNIEDIKNIAKLFNKKFELLQFKWDREKIVKYSYHYWEAEIFDFAFENSNLIQKSAGFFKATWRYIIKNINDLIEDYKNYEYFFYKWFGLNSTLCVNTAFFKVSRKFYKENLYKKQIEYYHKNTNGNFIPLESVFYNILKDKLFINNKKIIRFPIFHFFSIKNIFIENVKKYFWFLGYSNNWKIIDFLFKSKTEMIDFLKKIRRKYFMEIYLKIRHRNILKNNNNMDNVFSHIFTKNFWWSEESRSWKWSSKKNTRYILEQIKLLIKDHQIKTILDVPCWDCNRIEPKNIWCKYIWWDIVEELIKLNKKRFPNVEFHKIDITSSVLPKVDLVFCRECLQHLSFENVFKAIKNFKKSWSTYLLTSTYINWVNKNIKNWMYFEINLDKDPFSFPHPIMKIEEKDNNLFYRTDKWEYLYLYKLKNILTD